MTAPTLGEARPVFRTANKEAPPVDFGPDPSNTPEKDAPPKPTTARAAKKVGTGGLGMNKKTRSPVRKLTRDAPSNEELSDLEKLTARYRGLAKMAQMFHPKFAQACDAQAEDCAQAWFELAENNDKVRRWILAVLEGGAWGGVIAAHTPLIMAVIPEATLNRFFLKGMGMFARNAEQSQEDTSEDRSFGPGFA